MFLHSAAGLHGHEYSLPADRNSLPRRSAFAPSLKRAMSVSSPSPRNVTPSYTTTSGLLPRRNSTFVHSTSTRPPVPSRPLSDSFPRAHEPVVRFIEPEADTMSEDARSVANSESSETTAGSRRRKRRSTRTSTAYHIAHPAPTLTQKQRLLQIRPKLLMQLQKLSAESRPIPAIDVLPSTVVVPRLAKKFPRMFKGKAELGINDVMVVKSEDYDTSDDHAQVESESDEEGFENRELMACICQMPKGGGRAEIVLSDGSVWIATPLPNGHYEFNTVDDRGNQVIARWVKRNSRRSTAGTVESLAVEPTDFKFTFSIIDPNSRRHPIMASLTRSTLDIPDSYVSVSSSAGKCPPTSPIRSFPGDPDWQAPPNEVNCERTSHAIDENMRNLIQVTGIWVALRQGLSPYFKYNDMASCSTSSSPIPRNGSIRGEAGRASPALTSTPPSIFGGRILSKCVKGGSVSSNASVQTQYGGLPRRSVSTGSAFMQRATARRAGIFPSTVASESEGEGIFKPPQRAATLETAGSAEKEVSTPHHQPILGSSMDTPTKPQRRSQPAYVFDSVYQNSASTGSNDRSSVDFADRNQSLDSGEKIKTGRWKAFKDFFRRSNTRSG